MQLTASSVDYAPQELHDQTPFVVNLLRQIPGDDRSDYWLGTVKPPIRYVRNNIEQSITHLVVAARWAGTSISPGVEHLPIGIAFVTDVSLLTDTRLDLKKCDYVAIGICSETSGGKRAGPLTSILTGSIRPGFGKGKKE